MATTYSKHILSGSTNGRPIAITHTAATGTTIHTTLSGTLEIDEIYLWATNLSTATNPNQFTLEFGGTSGSDNIRYTLPPGETIMISPGFPLQNALVVKAFATSSTVINVVGYVNRLTATA